MDAVKGNLVANGTGIQRFGHTRISGPATATESSMHRIATAIVTITAGSLLAVATAAQPTTNGPKAITATALDRTPQSRVEAMQGIDAAIAAALIGAITQQFDERTIQVKLDHVDSTPTSIAQRDVHGTGRVKIGEDARWIPIAFSTLYDTTDASVGFPSLTLGATAEGNPVPSSADISRDLADEVGRRLGSEFASQRVQFDLDQVRVSHVGGRYLLVDANGTTDFGSEGRTATGVHALYDPRRDQWLRVSYELGPTANRADSDAVDSVVAVR